MSVPYHTLHILSMTLNLFYIKESAPPRWGANMLPLPKNYWDGSGRRRKKDTEFVGATLALIPTWSWIQLV